MSYAAAVGRVQELQGLLGAMSGQQAAPPAATAFATQLADATTSAASAPVGAGAPSPGTTTTFASSPSGGTLAANVPYRDQIEAAAARSGIDPALLAGLIRQESNFNAGAVSPAGARGLTQLMPGTAAGLGVGDPSDPAQAIEGGARYLKQMLDRFGRDTVRALAAYNAGPGAVERFGGVPPYAETQRYVRAVQSFAAAYRSSAAPALT
jgi:soluble lytic murein transglycosylase-like protein